MEKYNFEFDTSFDFEAISVPPTGLVNDRMVGLHIDWDRSLRGLILNRDVRETLWECYKTFPHFCAPVLLTSSNEFLKFVYYSKLHRLKYLPPNYLPVKHRHNPKEWEAIERQYRGETVESAKCSSRIRRLRMTNKTKWLVQGDRTRLSRSMA